MEDLDLTCRTCNAVRSNLINLCSNIPGNDNLNLLDILCSVCPSLSIQNKDRFPQKICFFCSKQLEIAYKFQQQCTKSHEEQLKILEKNIKEEPTQLEELMEDEQFIEELLESENNDARSCQEDDFEDTAEMFPESPEFLEDDDEEPMISHLESPTTIKKNSVSDENSTEASFDCQICSKKYLTSNGLLFHMKISHKSTSLKSQTFECKYCNKLFENRNEQKEHSRLEHKNAQQSELSCRICKKNFTSKSRFDHHLLFHGKNQYQCLQEDCQRIFVMRYKLVDHLKRYHGIILSIRQSKSLKPISVEES